MSRPISPKDNKKALISSKKRSQWAYVWHRLKKNKAAMVGLIMIIIIVSLAVFADFVAPYHYDDQNLEQAFQFPSMAHWFGTDNFGRDILSRIIYGARISLSVGFIAVGIATLTGGFIGAIASYYGGRIDNILMRIMDILLSIPSILLAIAITAALGSNLVNVMIAIGIGSVPSYARIVRASVLTVREQEFIEASRAVNASDFQIIFKHVIPNAMAPIIVQVTLGVANAILAIAGLSFIGLGIQPPAPEWGAMLSTGRNYIREYWHIVTFPGAAIMLTIFAINLFGDGLRDALDPRLKN